MSFTFKHTSGESFQLNSNDYVGFFNLSGDNVLSGKIMGVGEKLTPKNTFLSEIYSKNIQLDTHYRNIDKLKPKYSNVLDVLNKKELENIFDTINYNNLLCYKSLVLDHPTIFNFNNNKTSFYGVDTNGNIIKYNDKIIFTKLFTDNPNFGFLENIITGSFVVDSNDNFKYICSDGGKFYILTGNFTSDVPLQLIYEEDLQISPTNRDFIHGIYNDPVEKRMIFVKNDFLEIYDASNYDKCDNLLLMDKISLVKTKTREAVWGTTNIKYKDYTFKYSDSFATSNQNNPKFIKFGSNFRTFIDMENIYIYGKYDSSIIKTINLKTQDIGDISSIDIRYEDDYIVVLHKKNNNLHLWQSDIDISNVKNHKLESYNKNTTYVVTFSYVDSNIVFLNGNDECQTRHLTEPTYPIGRLNSKNLLYLDKFKWGNTKQKYKYIESTWQQSIYKSNYYSNLVITNLGVNDKMYTLLHNNGRLYTLSQRNIDRYYTNISLNLEKKYAGMICSNSSIGMFFNYNVNNLIQDTLNILNQTSGNFLLYEKEVLTNWVDNYKEDTKNLYINGNETINVVTLQRILQTIFEIQSKILSTSG